MAVNGRLSRAACAVFRARREPSLTLIAVQQSLRLFCPRPAIKRAYNRRWKRQHWPRPWSCFRGSLGRHGRELRQEITNEDILAFGACLATSIPSILTKQNSPPPPSSERRIAHGFLTGSLFSTVLGELTDPAASISPKPSNLAGRSILAIRWWRCSKSPRSIPTRPA